MVQGLGFIVVISGVISGLLAVQGLGFRVVTSGVLSPLTWVISIATLLITLFVTTHDHPVDALTCAGISDTF